MIFDDTSILDDLSDEERMSNERSKKSGIAGSIKVNRNQKLKSNYFKKYQHLYSKNEIQNSNISLEAISVGNTLHFSLIYIPMPSIFIKK